MREDMKLVHEALRSTYEVLLSLSENIHAGHAGMADEPRFKCNKGVCGKLVELERAVRQIKMERPE